MVLSWRERHRPWWKISSHRWRFDPPVEGFTCSPTSTSVRQALLSDHGDTFIDLLLLVSWSVIFPDRSISCARAEQQHTLCQNCKLPEDGDARGRLKGPLELVEEVDSCICALCLETVPPVEAALFGYRFVPLHANAVLWQLVMKIQRRARV